MPGINATGKPDTDDYNLGRGIVYFAELNTDGTPKEYRDLGNAPEFNISIETETLEHQSSRAGLKVTDKEVLISQKVSLSLTLDEINFQNVASLLSGETSSHTNPTAGGFGPTNIAPTGGIVQGRWYDIFETAYAHATTGRAYDITEAGDVLVTESTPTPGVLGTDYELDLVMGRVFVINGSLVLTAGEELRVTLTADAAPTTSVDEVKALTQSSVTGALKFIAENPAANDQQTEYQFHKVSLKAEGDFSLIGDEFSTMNFTAVAESETGGDADSPTLTVRTFAQ